MTTSPATRLSPPVDRDSDHCLGEDDAQITLLEYALDAAVIAECAFETTGEYWPAHDLLMKRGPSLVTGDLEGIAKELGVPADGNGPPD